MAEHVLPAGKSFGHYRIQGQLGAGGMGVVYSAYDTVLERKVAIKVVGDRVLADKSARDLLLHEARAASALNHPNICTIHQVGDSDGEAYIVMEHVEGQLLSSLVGAGGLSPELVIRYGTQIADALAHAHQHGVIHRDLKSTNALVTPEGRIKVLDFGLATRPRDAELQEAVSAKVPLTQSRMVVGTLPYLAPELLRAEPADGRTDIWALGVLLYEMASGTHPFHGGTAFELSSAILRDPPVPLPTTVSSGLGAVIFRCLEKLPGDRYQQASEVGVDLHRLERDADALRPRDLVKTKPVDPRPEARARLRPVRIAAWAASIVAVLFAAALAFRWLWTSPVPRVLRTTQITHYAHADGWGGVSSDGARIFYLARDADHWNLMQVPISGGESQPFPSPFRSTVILDVSPDQSEFLVAPFAARTANMEFWTLPVVGGAPRRLGDVTGSNGVFSPDGQKIVYSKADGIYVCNRNGSDPHKLVSLSSSNGSLAWSPDGKTLRFNLGRQDETSDLWEVTADGSNVHPLLPGWHKPANECCGRWSADGRYYFFLSTKEMQPGAGYSVWALREKPGSPLWSKPSSPVQLTASSTEFRGLSPTRDGRQLLTVAGTDNTELLWPTPDKKQFLPMRQFPEIAGVNVSPKGDWLALILRGWLLWRSRPDGSERIQLAADFPGLADRPRWSPDETRIVFEGVRTGRPRNIFLAQRDGGTTEELLPNDQVHKSPDWLPDGESIAYFTPTAPPGAPKADSGIFVLNLKTKTTTKLPGSDGLEEPRSAFGGRYLAALTEDQKKVVLFDFQTQRWKEIASGGKLFYHLESTRDLQYLYFQDLLAPGEPLYRMRAGDSKPERVMSFASLLQSGVIRCAFAGLTADGAPIVMANRGGTDVYALDLDLP
jgi:serine/threonine protein kinase/Tol biopolymer transport system component